MSRYVVLMFAAMLSGRAIAVTPGETGAVIHLQAHGNPDGQGAAAERFVIRLDGIVSDNLCGSDGWTGYLGTNAGRAQYSALLAASMAGKQVKIEGTAPDRCESGLLLVRNVYTVW